jgi:VCBS repeat-containing protein
VAIAPDAFVEIAPPTVADDAGTATHLAGTSGNVLANDETGLTVVAVNGMSSNVGVEVDGDNGGVFTINADGSWTFDPDGDFALLSGSETAETSVTYHASDGTAEAMATLTVTVSYANAAPVAVDDTGTTTADATTSGNVMTNDTDADADTLAVSQVNGSAANVGVAVAGSNGGLFTIGADGAWTFDPGSDFDTLTDDDTATTSVTYHVSDGVAEDEGLLTVTVSAASAVLWTPAEITTAQWLDFDDDAARIVDSGLFTQVNDKSGNSRNATASGAVRPTLYTDANGRDWAAFDGVDDYMSISVPQVAGSSIFAVVDTTNLQTGYRALFERITSSAPHAPNAYLGSGSGYDYRPGIFWGYNFPLYYSLRVSTQAIFEFLFSSGSVGITLNGGNNAIASSAYSNVTTWIQINSNSTQRSKCKIGEYIIINSEVDATTRQKIEGYLAHKWGLSANLPSDHPYKSAAPTI